MRGVRGATTVDENTKEAIFQSVQELVTVMMERNGIGPEEIGA
ncbi:MAG: chorismate mutase, partial [Selenomonadaceae bacterium]|nr:chorismate mutase [Selenomonadaceae bacterium]